MLEAFAWGLLGASSLLIGAVLGLVFDVPKRLIGLILAFGAGTLISAVSFELTEQAFRLGGADTVALGLALGALAYFAGDVLIDRRSAGQSGDEGSAMALLLGAVLDGIPESAVIGTTLIGGGEIGVAVLAAVFLSNLPESLSSAGGMRSATRGPLHVLAIWIVVVLVCGAASALGFAVLDGASGDAVGLLQSFAAGAVLTMLADTMFPTAFADGGKPAGLLTVFGFALAYLLSTIA